MRVRLFFLLSWLGCWLAGSWAGDQSRVAVVATTPAALEAAALVEAALSSEAGVDLVSREEIALLFNEQALSGERRDLVAMGRVLRADWIVGVVGTGKGWEVFAVDAATGEQVDSRRVGRLEGLGEQAGQLRLELVEGGRSEGTVAVLENEGLELGDAGFAVRDWCTRRGYRVLDRELTLRVIEERESAETGFRGGDAGAIPAFPGADFLVRLDRGEDGVRVSVMGARGEALGAMMARFTGTLLPREVAKFLEERLGGSPEDERPVFRQRVEPEALEPYYRGVSLFAAGKPLEATAEFQRAYELNSQFVPAYLWEARCYDAVGLPGFAAAIRRFAELGLVGRGAAAGADSRPRDGVTFLGVTLAERSEGASDASATAVAMEAIEALAGPELLLPESLGLIRDEYDLLARTSHTEGARWETSVGFVSRWALLGGLSRGPAGPWQVDWSLINTISGNVVAEMVTELPRERRHWGEVLRETLPSFVTAGAGREQKGEMGRVEIDLPGEGEILESIKTAKNRADRNVHILQLLLVNPAHPKAIGMALRKGSDGKDGLDGFLNFARRDYLIAHLPEAHPMRDWLEFERLQAFLQWPGNGEHFSGEEVDAVAELGKFSTGTLRDPDHPARVAARYFWLFDSMAGMKPEKLAAESAELLRRLEALPDEALPRRDSLAKLTRTIHYLARVVGGETNAEPPADFYGPERFRVEISDEGKPRIEWNDVSSIGRKAFSLFDDEEVRREFAFAIAFQGRGDRLIRVEPDWLEQFPRSLNLAGTIVYGAMRSALQPVGRPWIGLGAENSGTESRHWRRMADYAADTLAFWLGRAKTEEEYERVETYVAYFFHRLCNQLFREVVSDEEYAAWHEEFRAASRVAAARCGVPDRTKRTWDRNMLNWRVLTRAESGEQLADQMDAGPGHFFDRTALLAAEEAAFERAMKSGKPADWRRWWSRTDGDVTIGTSASVLAERMASGRLAGLRQAFLGKALFDDDRAMLVDCGIVLMQGRRDAEAEAWLRDVGAAPMSSDSSEALTEAIRASADYHLGRVLRVTGQRAEAMTAFRSAVSRAKDRNVRSSHRIGPNYRDWILRATEGDSISADALRALEATRFEPEEARLPRGVSAVRVLTPQLNNPELTVFYRVPIDQNVDDERARRVLVLAPSMQEGVLPMLDEDSAWARFANENNLVLVAPQFNAADYPRRLGHALAAYQNAQSWSGDALVLAVEKIGKRTPLDDKPWLLHGYGGGAQFVQSFSRWNPARTAALSAHSASTWAWLEGLSGQRPLAELSGIPTLVTVGEDDDAGINDFNRRASTEQFVTMLRAAGCEPEFRILPGVAHQPTRELVRTSQEFLARALE